MSTQLRNGADIAQPDGTGPVPARTAEDAPLAILAARLRRARHARAMTLEDLARRAGCTRGYISQIENAKNIGVPSRAVIARLEAALALGPGDLAEPARQARHARLEADDHQAVTTDPHNPHNPHDPHDPTTSDDAKARVRAEMHAALASGLSLDALHARGILSRWANTPATSRAPSHVNPHPRDLRPLPAHAALRTVPLMNVVQAGEATAHADLGHPAGWSDRRIAAAVAHEAGWDVDAFACQIVGMSMAPRYEPGDIVIFSPAKPVTPGSDCFVRIDPHTTHAEPLVTFKRIWFVSTLADAPATPQSTPTTTCPTLALAALGYAPIALDPDSPAAHTHIALEPLNRAGGFAIRILPRDTIGLLAPALQVIRGV